MATQQAQTLFSDLMDIAEASPEPEQFRRDFQKLFRRIGLSHVVLSVQHRRAAELGRHFDSLQVGPNAVSLGWDQSVARLTVRTFNPQSRSSVVAVLGYDKAKALAKVSYLLQRRVPLAKKWRALTYKASGMSTVQIARTLCMTDVAVRNWFRAAG